MSPAYRPVELGGILSYNTTHTDRQIRTSARVPSGGLYFFRDSLSNAIPRIDGIDRDAMPSEDHFDSSIFAGPQSMLLLSGVTPLVLAHDSPPRHPIPGHKLLLVPRPGGVGYERLSRFLARFIQSLPKLRLAVETDTVLKFRIPPSFGKVVVTARIVGFLLIAHGFTFLARLLVVPLPCCAAHSSHT